MSPLPPELPGSRGVSSTDDILDRAADGDRRATRELFQAVYADLRRVAAARLKGEAPGQTLSPTALVHEALLRLDFEAEWHDASHLYRTAANTIRRILVDRARQKRSLKRGAAADRADLSASELPAPPSTIDPVELHEALDLLANANPLAGEVFTLRYFAGLTWSQIAAECDLSVEKTESLWTYARAKLACSLSEPT